MKTFRFAFVSAIGAYLGWHICEGLDKSIGRRLTPKVQPLIDKLDEWGKK